jgi:hypothetical protein
VILAVAVVVIALGIASQTSVMTPLINRLQGEKTVNDRLAEYGPSARQRLEPAFRAAGVAYPPARVVFAAFKTERILEVYASSAGGQMHYIKTYPILGASGRLGPKLMEDDGQVPEGMYPIVFLNANSAFHLSLRLGYPNEFDRGMAARDGRKDLGQDIMIHGGRVSIGCLAMGDTVAEDLFVLTADAGRDNIKVVISPIDFRSAKLRSQRDPLPSWTTDLYHAVKLELAKLPTPTEPTRN